VPHHLEPVPFGAADEPLDPFGPDDDLPDFDEDADGSEPGAFAPLVRPAWWRWVAIAVIVSMVAGGPLAYLILKLLD
jgi:hypothetical protein